jgi:hypothetical protein
MEKIKFVTITRTICPKGKTHYLDAISDTEGQMWSAEQQVGIELWLVYTSTWKKSGQMPLK